MFFLKGEVVMATSLREKYDHAHKNYENSSMSMKTNFKSAFKDLKMSAKKVFQSVFHITKGTVFGIGYSGASALHATEGSYFKRQAKKNFVKYNKTDHPKYNEAFLKYSNLKQKKFSRAKDDIKTSMTELKSGVTKSVKHMAQAVFGLTRSTLKVSVGSLDACATAVNRTKFKKAEKKLIDEMSSSPTRAQNLSRPVSSRTYSTAEEPSISSSESSVSSSPANARKRKLGHDELDRPRQAPASPQGRKYFENLQNNRQSQRNISQDRRIV